MVITLQDNYKKKKKKILDEFNYPNKKIGESNNHSPKFQLKVIE